MKTKVMDICNIFLLTFFLPNAQEIQNEEMRPRNVLLSSKEKTCKCILLANILERQELESRYELREERKMFQ